MDLVNILEYAFSLQFVDRLEKDGKISSSEKLKLREVIETVHEKVRVGNIIEDLRKHLTTIKIS